MIRHAWPAMESIRSPGSKSDRCGALPAEPARRCRRARHRRKPRKRPRKSQSPAQNWPPAPPSTIRNRCHHGLRWKDIARVRATDRLSGSGWLAGFMSPTNRTYPPSGSQPTFQRVPALVCPARRFPGRIRSRIARPRPRTCARPNNGRAREKRRADRSPEGRRCRMSHSGGWSSIRRPSRS